ncbi:hypothetical protein CVT26_015457 [Gymnopilus dilepis]|uniref:Uncharacterized protein n=1 Tax=Gymnopilus dilepis TaxID=231916 RepID=A0A409W4H1_9AGAR|nr:hypothetical protein CVT26_015457 [Gymnopilus dilepis]
MYGLKICGTDHRVVHFRQGSRVRDTVLPITETRDADKDDRLSPLFFCDGRMQKDDGESEGADVADPTFSKYAHRVLLKTLRLSESGCRLSTAGPFQSPPYGWTSVRPSLPADNHGKGYISPSVNL